MNKLYVVLKSGQNELSPHEPPAKPNHLTYFDRTPKSQDRFEEALRVWADIVASLTTVPLSDEMRTRIQDKEVGTVLVNGKDFYVEGSLYGYKIQPIEQPEPEPSTEDDLWGKEIRRYKDARSKHKSGSLEAAELDMVVHVLENLSSLYSLTRKTKP